MPVLLCKRLLPHAATCARPPLWLQIVSGSRDKTIRLWNTLGECKYSIGEPEGHSEWVSVRGESGGGRGPWTGLVAAVAGRRSFFGTEQLPLSLLAPFYV